MIALVAAGVVQIMRLINFGSRAQGEAGGKGQPLPKPSRPVWHHPNVERWRREPSTPWQAGLRPEPQPSHWIQDEPQAPVMGARSAFSQELDQSRAGQFMSLCTPSAMQTRKPATSFPAVRLEGRDHQGAKAIASTHEPPQSDTDPWRMVAIKVQASWRFGNCAWRSGGIPRFGGRSELDLEERRRP